MGDEGRGMVSSKGPAFWAGGGVGRRSVKIVIDRSNVPAGRVTDQ
jgi:hypothetical protein